MDLTRLGGKRTRRTRTWASVCAGLFGDGAVGDRAVADNDRGGSTVGDREDENHADDTR